MSESPTFGHGNTTLRELLQESLSYKKAVHESVPPLNKLEAEHRRMKKEISVAEAAEDNHFENTWFSWAERERGKRNEEEL